jgi:hypothetical protein
MEHVAAKSIANIPAVKIPSGSLNITLFKGGKSLFTGPFICISVTMIFSAGSLPTHKKNVLFKNSLWDEVYFKNLFFCFTLCTVQFISNLRKSRGMH